MPDSGPDDFLKQQLLTMAVQQSPAPMLITDLKGTILYCNDAFCANTGYTPAELVGKNPKILKSGFTPESVYKEMWTTVLGGNTWRGELCNKAKSGKIYWESIVIAPLKDAAGKISYLAGVWLNITDKKFEEGLIKNRMVNMEHDAALYPLTGLYNRRHITLELEREVARSVRYKRLLSGVLVDIDDFKKLAERYGYLAGDVALREVASVIEKNIRSVDVVGRYGGDVFLILFPEASAENAAVVTERIRRTIASQEIRLVKEKVRLTVSIGLCVFQDKQIDDKAVFLGRMEEALHEAKKKGKNQVVIRTF